MAKEELKKIELFNTFSDDEKKLRTFLSLFYKDNRIDDIILELKFSLENKSNLYIIGEHLEYTKINENLFELYKIKYKKEFLYFSMKLRNYKKNSFHS